jgi:FkbM family methyltransferase
VTSLRRDLDLEAMVVFSDRQADQYFEPFVRLHGGSTFLDVGAFDGYTTAYAQRKFGVGLECHLFEPSPTMFHSLKRRFADNEGVTLYPIGLADRPQRVLFDDSGSSSRIGVGSSSIEVDALDRLSFARVDFIKVDVEGAEQLFLDGAQETIKRCQPQLALACYHSNRQILDLYERARELLPDARVYLRHYTEGFAETDLFFIPPRFW